MIELTFKSMGSVYKSEGETLKEALDKLQISGKAKAMAILAILLNAEIGKLRK